MSTVIAQTEPTASMSAPATGLIARPGATAAKASHPARTGEPVRASAYSTIASANMRPASRDSSVASNNARTSVEPRSSR